MADEIKLKAPTVEQQVVVNINGEEKLRSFADTLEKISNNKNLQKYWKTQQELINATADAYGNFSKKASQDNAKELIKVTNALKAMSGTDLSNILPDFDKISKAMAEAQKVAGNIDSAFSVKGFKEAFDSFETLKAYGVDIQNLFTHFGVSTDVGELQKNVRALEDEVGKLTRRLSNAKNANEELRNEFENFKSGSGFADKLDELDNLKSEMSYIREEAEEIFRQFLKLNNISEDGYDREGFYDDNRFREYFQNIQSGYMSASDAIRQFKTEYSYLLEESFKTNNDTFGLEQLQAFSNKLDSIFRQVEETSTKINDIISNGVITKSVENLSMDSSLSDSQRSLFGNLLQDEESLKSITALFQKLIEESNKTSKVDLFNDEQLQQVLSIFDKIEKHLSSLRSIISDVGDGEEFSPLLKALNDIKEAASNIKLNFNMDLGDEVSERLNQKVSQASARQLEAYRKLFSAMKGTGKTNKEMLKFFEPDEASVTELIGTYKGIIERAEKQFKVGNSNIYKKYLGAEYDALKREITNANKQLSRADSKRSENGILGDLFGNTKDLSEVIEQLNRIVSKLDEISSSASEFKNVFKEGFNITAFVEEIDKLTNRVKELEDELAKVKLNPVSGNKSNISSGTQIEDVFQGGTTSAEKLEEEIKNIDSATEKASESAKEYRKILSQVGEFDIDSKVSAMYKRNDGQLESWTWRAKKDDEGNVLYDQNGKIDYDEPTVTVISKYEQLEKIIVKADNELRNLQKDLAEIKAYDPTASTTNIEAKISDQKEYIRLLEQTVKVISQSDEYLLDEQQIIEARNKAAREYALTTGAKQEKTDAKQSASDEKKRLVNIEQVNRALNKQQITIDAIEKTYNKTTNPDLDREVSNQQDLAELAQKKLAIQTKINSLQGKERNSANEKEFLELEKLIAEYKELAKYKLKANNPSKQELGGQNLQTLIQEQIYKYDRLITKAEKYGDATSETVEKLKEQKDILSKMGSDGKYSATADQYYASRDTYKVESAALSAFDAETKAAEQEAKAVKDVWDKNVKAIQDYMDAVTKLNNLNAKDKGTGKYASQIALQEKNVEELKEKALEARTAITSMINPHDVPLNTWRDYLDVMKKFDQASLGSAESVAKLEDALRKMDFSSLESAGTKFDSQFKNLSIKPDGDHQFLSWTNDLKELNAKIDEYNSKVKYLKENNIVDGEQVEEVKKLRNEIEEIINVMTKTPQTKRGWTDIGASKAAEKVANVLKQNTKMSKEAKDAIRAYYNELRSGNPSQPIDEILVKVNQLVQKERELGRVGKSFGEIFKEKVIYGGAAQLAGMVGFYDVINVIRQAGEAVIDLNTNITELAKVSEASVSQIYDDFNSYADIAKEVGGTISDTISATADWSRNGYNIPDSKELAEVAMIYKNVGDGIDIDQANEYLISTLRGFSLEAKDAMDIIDSINEVANNEPISSAGIGEALQRSAAAFNVANTSLQESIALVTSTNSVLQSPEKVGSMWTTVSARIRGAKTELEDAGLETDGMVESTSKLQSLIKGMTGFDILEDDQKTFKSIYDIIIGIGEEFQNLSGVDQAALLEALAGKRQSNALAATLNNIDLLKKAYGEATNAEGSAMAEQEKYQQSIQYSIDRTKASLEELANDFISSDFLKGLIDSGDKLINILDLLIDKFGVLGTTAIVGGGIFGAKNIGREKCYPSYRICL